MSILEARRHLNTCTPPLPPHSPPKPPSPKGRGREHELVLGRRESIPLLPFQVQQFAYVYSPHKRQSTTIKSAHPIATSRTDPTPMLTSETDLAIIDPVLSSFSCRQEQRSSYPMIRSPAPRPDSEIFPAGAACAPIAHSNHKEDGRADTAQEVLIERIVAAAFSRLLAAEGLKVTPIPSTTTTTTTTTSSSAFTTPSDRRERGDSARLYELFQKLNQDSAERTERILCEIGILRSEVVELRRHVSTHSQTHAQTPAAGVAGDESSGSKGGLFGSIFRKSVGRPRASSGASTTSYTTTPVYSSPAVPASFLPLPTMSNSEERFDKLDASLAQLTRKVDLLESHSQSRPCTASTVMSPPRPDTASTIMSPPTGVLDTRVNRLLWPRPRLDSRPALVEVWRDVSPERGRGRGRTTATYQEATENEDVQVGTTGVLGHRVQRSSLDFGVNSVQGSASASSRPEHGLRIPGLDRDPSVTGTAVGKEKRVTAGLAGGTGTAKVREEGAKIVMEAKGKVREGTPVAYRFMRELPVNPNTTITTSTSTSPAKLRLSPRSGKRKGDAVVYGPQGSPLKKMISKPFLVHNDVEMSPWTQHILAGTRAPTVGESQHARSKSTGLSCTSPARRRMTFGFGPQEEGGGAGVRRGMTLLERRRNKSLGGPAVRKLALVERHA